MPLWVLFFLQFDIFDTARAVTGLRTPTYWHMSPIYQQAPPRLITYAIVFHAVKLS